MILNTKTPEAALDEAVFAEQVDLLFNERFDLVANVVVASALASILGRLFPAWIWISWLTSVWLVILGRAAMPYRRLVAVRGPASAQNAARLYLVAKSVTGCLWGLTGAVVLVTPDLLYQVFIVLLLAGMVAGGIVRNAAFRPAMVAFILPAVLPVIVMLLTRPSPAAFDLGVLVAIFTMVLVGNGLNINRTIVESLRSRVEQELLVVKLSASEASMAEARSKLEFANMLLKTEFEASPDGILVVDGDRKILSCNQRFLELWGLDGDAIHRYDGHALATASTVIKDPDRFLERVEFLYDHPAENGVDEIEFLDGRFVDRRTAALESPDGAYLGRVWYFRDISKRKRAELRAIEMANFDVLTGLTNRSVFVATLGRAIAEADRVKKTFAVIYLDLDHFQDINDTLGHPVGDGLLRAVANRLRSNMRAGDTLARFGGDEFAVLVADLEDPAVAGFVADKLLAALAVPFEFEQREIRTGASIGIDVYGPDSAQPETLLAHADVALYRAKSEARGGYRFFTDAMDDAVRERVTLGAELRSAVARGQLFLLYQPQVAIGTGRIIGVEALVRWQHPERGTLGPELFIPVAERTGNIVALGRWALHTACRQARSWLDAGIAPVPIAVNVSGLQFKSPLELEADVTTALAEARLPPRLLEIELTESALMDVTTDHSDALGRLRASGVTLAIDDFGTGYSSLGYLGSFPVDRIKIAREFVKDIATEPGQVAVAKATIGLARDLGIAVIAEGVETREQLEVLRSLGCLEVQGFYFSKPLDAEEITPALRNGRILAHHALPSI